MKTRNILVSLLAIACALALVATGVSAGTTEIVKISSIEIKGITDKLKENIAVKAGETIPVKIAYEAVVDASDVRVRAEIVGTKVVVTETVKVGDIEKGSLYTETLNLRVPYELQDKVSDNLEINIRVWNGEYSTDHSEIVVKAQRATYKTEVMSINTQNNVRAGNLFPVDVVLKNVGYNKLNELYVTVSMPALDVSRTVYSGDLEAIETNEEDDTVSVKVYLKVPYTAKAGVYSIQVDVTNEDLKETATKNIFVKNEFTSNVIVSDNRKSAEAGEDAVYELLVVNPTNDLKLYRFVVDSPSGVDTAISSSVVTIQAGSSKVVKVTANADSEGEYNIDVNVFAGENVVETANLELNAEGSNTSAAVVLTIILVVVFVVLLAVFVVLMTRKPKKADEIGESYY